MSALSNHIKAAKTEILTVLVEMTGYITGAGLVWGRMRYADNLKQWADITSPVSVAGVQSMRCCFIYENTFRGEFAEARTNKITVSYSWEIIHQFIDGTDEQNSTQDFNDFCGDLMEMLVDAQSLPFTDYTTNPVFNTIPDGGESDGKPVLVDGLLAHRRIMSFDVTFRIKKGC